MAKGLLDHVFELAYFIPNHEGVTAIPFHRVDGEGPLVVVTGENASGKSFFRRIVQSICARAKMKTECIHISMEARRRISEAPWMTFVYGDEEYESTGVNSSGTVLGGIKTSQTRDDRHVIFWDEPDLGLGDPWAAGMGQAITQFVADPPEHLVASLLVTHSRALVGELIGSAPTYLHFGESPEEAPQSLQAWFERPIVPRSLKDLQVASHRRYGLIKAILDERRS